MDTRLKLDCQLFFNYFLKVVIVAINMGSSPISEQFSINGGTLPSSFSSYITSQGKNFQQQNNIKVTGGGSFTYSFPSQSVTTLVSV